MSFYSFYGTVITNTFYCYIYCHVFWTPFFLTFSIWFYFGCVVFTLHSDFSHDLTWFFTWLEESLQFDVLATPPIWLGIGYNLSEVNYFLLFKTEMFVTMRYLIWTGLPLPNSLFFIIFFLCYTNHFSFPV